MQRGAGVLEDGNVQKALQADLQDAQTAIHDEHDGCQQEGKRMAAFEGQHCDKEAHCAAAGIAHQQAGRLCVGPQIGQQRTHEHNACGAVLGQLCFIGQQVGTDGHHCNTCRKAVHAVGAVDHIDAGPDQNNDQQQVHSIRQSETPLQEIHTAAVEVEVGHTCNNGNGKINDTLFILVPCSFSSIVKVAGQHGCNEQDGVDDVFHLERQECQRYQCDAQHEDQAGTTGLTLGKRTVHRKLAAMVVRKLIVKNGVHQSRKGKRQQECQSIDAALSYDRKQ